METAQTELDQLEAAAAAVDNMAEQGAADLAPAAAEQPAADPAAEVAALLSLLAGILAPLFPSLPGIYTEPTCKRLGDAAAPVLLKYEVSVGGLFDRWGPEIGLAAAALPVAIATAQGIKADLAARRKKADDETPAAGPLQAGQIEQQAGGFSMGEKA